MIFLYNIGIFFYSLFIRIVSVFNEKARFFVRGRRNWRARMEAQIEKEARYLWFHCASLGEFEQGRPVIEALKKQFPEFKIVLTFFSPSGYEIRKNYHLVDVVAYLPLDSARNARDFLSLVNPERAFFIKYEFWFHYITALKRRNIPLYIISAIFRKEQLFFKNTLWSKWFREMLFRVEHFFVQDETSVTLLKSVGLTNVTIAGDTRFDRVHSIAKSARKIPIVEKFRGNAMLVVAGSTWKPDEEMLTTFINNHPGVKFIIAPHEVSAANINRIHQMLKTSAISFSKLRDLPPDRFQVLIIDSIGLLSALYRYGDLAYIGGGFGVGIHNILEAATFGLPVIFGPKFKNFKEAVDLVSLGGAFSVRSSEELKAAFETLLNDESLLKIASDTSRNYVEKNVGSTKFIIKKVFNKPSVLD